MRATLSPAFTSSKMRQMFELLVQIAAQMGEYFKNLPADQRVVELKDILTRYALDVIASTNFGVQIDSLIEKDNQFYRNTMRMLNWNAADTRIRVYLSVLLPKVMDFFKIRLLSQKKTIFFEDLIRDTIKTRKAKGIIRTDLMNLLIQMKKGQLKNDETNEDIGFATVHEADLGKVTSRTWTDEKLLAQAFIFFFAGYETIPIKMSFIAYSLASNPEIQDKLIKEIDKVEEELQGKHVNYETLRKMKYMDQVVTEGLRYWATDMADRLCVKDYKMKNDQGDEFTIKKGSLVWFPVIALHFSEKYYEDPEKFDPERFSEENKHKIDPSTYLAFGVGPRNCMGSRFALMEVKAGLYYLLKNCRLEICDKTEVPLKIKKGLLKHAENGVWLRTQSRK